MPDVLITSLGTDIHFAPEYTADTAWTRHIDHLWTPAVVRTILDELPGLARQPKKDQQREDRDRERKPPIAVLGRHRRYEHTLFRHDADPPSEHGMASMKCI